MEPSGKIVINIISSDDEEDEQSDLKKKELDDDCVILDGDCVILDGDPDKPHRVVGNKSTLHGSESDEVVIVAEKGQVACRDYPHARYVCARFPFNTNPHEKYCALCHCYVCDTLAPCDHWGRGMSSGDHCHATDKEEIWRALRQYSKNGEGAQLLALNNPVNTPSNAPILHPTTGPSRPMSGGEGRAVTAELMVTDQLTVQTDRLTGSVKWYDCRRGYGFITPDSGGEDLFVHRSSIKSVGYRYLAEGDAVEFRIEIRDDGRKAAVEVIGLDMSFVQETTTRGSDLIDSHECDKCGETGHLARNCVVCYNCGKTGHLARNCSCTGSETDGNDSDGSDTGRYNNCSDTRKCYKCGQTGHLTRNCVVCYNCGKTGHLARNCPNMGSESDDREDNTGSDTRRGNYRGDTRECYNCGRTGHLARNCSFSECRSSDTDNNESDTSEGDQLVVQAERMTGTVKWFSNEKGYGFITPDGGGEDLFVHQSSIKSKGYRSLAQGEVIEFQIERGDDGRKKAVDVTGPGGSFVQGTARREPYHRYL